uniref:Protein HflK n=1 Tax=uncultured Thiotrichaceae bacterium TaxID=298394 RepID=A0A6S6U952_9GAMM|nr:MAG: HflK protein [uncultured Thiotrichaceae bacterium]
MPWNEPGDDGSNNQKDPWTGKNKSSGSNARDAEEIVNKINQKLNSLFGGSGKDGDSESGMGAPGAKGIILLAIVLFAVWLFSGFYTVDARQEALVLRFGAYNTTTGPGLHWHLPYPIEKVEMINVAQNRSAKDRSSMLTIDENIVDVEVTVQYKVNSAKDYAFNVFLPDNLNDQASGTIYQVMRSASREIVGRSKMDFILREGREEIALETQKLMQGVLDDYEAGLQVIKVNLTYAEAPEAVKDAFDDANRAREDANRFKNEADTYSKKVVPAARGQAARRLEEANAYRDRVIAQAEGDASRFTQLVAEYSKAPEVTRERLYLETMETVMAGTRKIIVDSDSSNNLLYMPLGSDSSVPANMPSPAQIASPFVNSKSQLDTNKSSNGRTQRNLQPGANRGASQ